MTDTPAVNDIPAILARHDAAMKMSWGVFNIYPYLADVPNMAAEILSLRAECERLTDLVRFASDFSRNATP